MQQGSSPMQLQITLTTCLTLNHNPGYNDQEFFEFIAASQMSFLNTTQRGPLLPFKFGVTKYKSKRDQQDIEPLRHSSSLAPILASSLH